MTPHLRRKLGRPLVVVGAVALAATASGVGPGEPRAVARHEQRTAADASGVGEQAEPATASPGAAGMVIYRDPATGRLGQPPAGTAVAPAQRSARVPGVVGERPGATPAGGMLADGVLPWNTITVTTDATGKVATRCQHGTASGAGER